MAHSMDTFAEKGSDDSATQAPSLLSILTGSLSAGSALFIAAVFVATVVVSRMRAQRAAVAAVPVIVLEGASGCVKMRDSQCAAQRRNPE